MTERFTVEWVYPDHAGMATESIKDNKTNEIVDLELVSVFEKLNEIEKEKQHIESVIKEAYQTERTAIGKNVLKQLCENLEIGDD